MRFAAITVTALSWSVTVSAQDQERVLEEIIVTADFREVAAAQLPVSVSVLDANTLQDAGVQHFEELLLVVPNLNWSGETSRPRFLQIRGIGEREQYQGAPNPSVGFVVDDIDFSGIGMVATLFDVEQIEVLRGPQGTRYGANALAGLVNVTTRRPTEDFELHSELTAGGDGTFGAGLAVGGPVQGQPLKYRLAVQRYTSDGFRDNIFLGRSDTNQRDELTVRGKLNWEPTENWALDFTGMVVDLDNGYDAWAIDNGFITRSDKPGKDSQRSSAGAVKAVWRGNEAFELFSITTFADSDIQVSFDGDWGNDPDWGVAYDFTSDTLRKRATRSQEIRLVSRVGAEIFGGSTGWLVGAYVLDVKESNDTFELFNDAVFRDLVSDYDATSTALFGQLDVEVGSRTRLSAGLRTERREADYRDSDAVGFSPAETMWGGHVSLTHALRDNFLWYGTVLRGFKAGGFNIGASIPADRRQFDSEGLWSLETGFKGAWLGGALRGNIGFFYSVRDDQQVSTSLQLDPADPLSFVFFTDNAADGFNYGVEAELGWQPVPNWRFDASLGLLETEYDRFDSPAVALNGREQAHAPGYQFALAATYRSPDGFFGRVDIQGRDAFFFDDSHNQRSQSYELVHLKLGYEREHWTSTLWLRNLLDQEYAVRGFYFSNDPNDPLFTPQLFTRLGDPRQVGVTATYRF